MNSHKKRGTGRIGVLLVALAVGTAACGDDGTGVESTGGEAVTTTEQPNGAAGSGALTCGSEFELPAAGQLRLAGTFPETIAASEQMVNGEVEVTSDDGVRGTASPAADAFLVQDGKIATTPLAQDAMAIAWDLAAGASRTVPAAASLASCEPDGAPIPAGDYEVYARFVITPDGGEPSIGFGGPWRLRVT